MQRFEEFIDLAKRWPGDHFVRWSTCRQEYEAALHQGCTEAQILDGTEYWLERCVPADTSRFYAPAPHTFLRELSFLAYQPKQARLEVVK